MKIRQQYRALAVNPHAHTCTRTQAVNVHVTKSTTGCYFLHMMLGSAPWSRKNLTRSGACRKAAVTNGLLYSHTARSRSAPACVSSTMIVITSESMWQIPYTETTGLLSSLQGAYTAWSVLAHTHARTHTHTHTHKKKDPPQQKHTHKNTQKQQQYNSNKEANKQKTTNSCQCLYLLR